MENIYFYCIGIYLLICLCSLIYIKSNLFWDSQIYNWELVIITIFSPIIIGFLLLLLCWNLLSEFFKYVCKFIRIFW